MTLIRRSPRVFALVFAWMGRYERLLWAVHSLWAFALGVGVMWLGARNYAWLRVTLFYLAFLWVASLFVPSLVDRPEAGVLWRGRLRLVINYFTKNFYQQLLFFLLPIYYASASAWSANLVFVGLLAVSAMVSTFDVFFDQHLSVRRGLTAIFFAFNLFACINVMLPALWRISNWAALPLSAALAMVAFATILYNRPNLRLRRAQLQLGLAGLGLVLVVMFGSPFIPPAPLRVLRTDFGHGIDRQAIEVVRPINTLVPGWSGRVYGVTAIYAPLGLRDRVAHRWYQDGRLVYASSFYDVVGGRKDGYRLWTSGAVKNVRPGTRVRVDVETESGQLVGRAEIRGREATMAEPSGAVR